MDDEYLRHQKRLASAVIRQHGLESPFLLIDQNRIAEALSYFKTYLPGVRLFYATKANSSLNVLSFLAREGLSFDVSSAGEIEKTKSLGVDGHHLFLSTPIKTAETIEALMKHQVASCAVDTRAEVEKIAALREKKSYKHLPRIFVRVRLETKDVAVNLNTKFGALRSDALDIISRAAELGFTVGGVCFHVGTQSTNVENYLLGIESARSITEEALLRLKIRLPVINIGGGFCDSVTAAKANIDLKTYYQTIGKACKEVIDSGVEVYAEPGRCLVSDAGAAISSVIGTSMRGASPWAYLDDGIFGCYSIRLYEHTDFDFHRLSKRSSRTPTVKAPSGLWTVAGPTCDSLDVIAENRQLPLDLQYGDILMTPTMGAYSTASASNFNGFYLPKCYVVNSLQKNGSLLTTVSVDAIEPTTPEIAA